MEEFIPIDNPNHTQSRSPQPSNSSPPPPPPPVTTPLLSPFPATATTTPAATSSSNRVPEHMLYKNRLQEHTQRASLPFPVYQTTNEGAQHLPKFRSTVLVNGQQFTSPNTFLHRKEAEQEVARIALQCLLEKMKEEGCSFIHEETVFCKSILNEYAVKMQLQMPIYSTVPQGLPSVFVSSLVFNSVTYTGETGRTKKEAEQLAARVAILSLMVDSSSGKIISEMIKSKAKLYAAFPKIKDSHNVKDSIVTVQSNSVPSSSIPQAATSAIPQAATSAIPQAALEKHPPYHEFTTLKAGPTGKGIQLPITFVPPVLSQLVDAGCSSGKKRKKNKRKANKKMRSESQSDLGVRPMNLSQVCGVNEQP